jgi:hypothetical protein
MATVSSIVGHVPGVIIGPTPPQFKIVKCPACPSNETIVVERQGDQVFIRDFKEPRQCRACGQVYQLTWRLEIGAEKIGG